MLAVSMLVEEAVACLDRQAQGVERPFVRYGRAAHKMRATDYGLCVVVVLMAASWQEAHVSGRTDHNRLVDSRDNMGSLKRQWRVWLVGGTVAKGWGGCGARGWPRA